MRRNQATHVTRGNIFDDLGFDTEESLELKVRSEILMEVQNYIRKKGYSQKELGTILGEKQSIVSKLINGKLSSLTIDRLLRFAGKLNLGAQIRIVPNKKPAKAVSKGIAQKGRMKTAAAGD